MDRRIRLLIYRLLSKDNLDMKERKVHKNHSILINLIMIIYECTDRSNNPEGKSSAFKEHVIQIYISKEKIFSLLLWTNIHYQ